MTFLDEHPFHDLPYRYPRTGGGPGARLFPIHAATAQGLPPDLAGLVIASDLQGVGFQDGPDGTPRLIGYELAEELFLLSGSPKTTRAEQTGVILGGDLHVSPDLEKRGGKGDVRSVWSAFRDCFRWIAGVAGNHDRFGDGRGDLNTFRATRGVFYLDGEVRAVDSLLLGGVGGIIGNPEKPFRRTQADYLALVRAVLDQNPSLLILHESPAIEEAGLPGSEALRRCLEEAPPTLVVCGHIRWPGPGLATLANGTQVLNVEGRAVWIRRDAVDPSEPVRDA